MAASKIEHVAKAAVSKDQELADHLKQAEHHLIAAVKLFEKRTHPQRTHDYVARLTRAQEMTTHLFREELVRIRGPIKMTVKRRKKVTS
jgi:hypothetical protein